MKKNTEKLLGSVFAYTGAMLIVLLVGWLVFFEIIESATGETYTEEKWWNAEQYYCAKYGMEAQSYIANQCSLFGCVEVERTKCFSDNREKKIDYDDKIFCQYSLKGDMGMC